MNDAIPPSASRPVWFPGWGEALARANLPAATRTAYRTAVCHYLRFCKATRQRATVTSARQFMAAEEEQRRASAAVLAEFA